MAPLQYFGYQTADAFPTILYDFNYSPIMIPFDNLAIFSGLMGSCSLFASSGSLKSILEGKLTSNIYVPIVGSLSEIQNISISLSITFIHYNNFNSIKDIFNHISICLFHLNRKTEIKIGEKTHKQYHILEKKQKYNYFQQQFQMKKIRIDKNQLNQTISFLSKKTYNHNRQNLLPQKRVPLQSIQNHTNNKLIKTEGTNVINEKEAYFNKQIMCSSEKSSQLKSGSIAKAKCQNAYRKDIKRIAIDLKLQSQKDQTPINSKLSELDPNFFIIYNVERNLSLTNSPQKLQAKDRRISIQRSKIVNVHQIVSLGEKQGKQEMEQKMDNLIKENLLLLQQVQGLTRQLNHKIALINQKQEFIATKIKKQQLYNDYKHNLEQSFVQERAYYYRRIDQLTFQNHNLTNINLQFINDRQKLIKQLGFNNNGDFQRKIEFLQTDIRQYQKREDIYSKEVQRLRQQLRKIIQSTLVNPIEQIKISNQSIKQSNNISTQQFNTNICEKCKPFSYNQTGNKENTIKTAFRKQNFKF